MRDSGITQLSDRINNLLRPTVQWTDADEKQYRDVQNSIPAGPQVMVRVSKPFLFNFQRNTIYTVDSPGGASPPPGIPIMSHTSEMADYLLTKSIRYIIYSYGDEAGYSSDELGQRLPLRDYYALGRIKYEALYILIFQKHLSALGKLYKKIYDDGQIFVLDLGQRNPV